MARAAVMTAMEAMEAMKAGAVVGAALAEVGAVVGMAAAVHPPPRPPRLRQ